MSVYVYIIGYPHAAFGHAVKVGVSANVLSRICALQPGNADRIEFYFAFRVRDRRRAMQVERVFHELMDSWCIRGEWFGIYWLRALYELTEVVRDILGGGEQIPPLEARYAGLDVADQLLARAPPEWERESPRNE